MKKNKKTKHPKWLQQFWESKVDSDGKVKDTLADTPGLHILPKYTGKTLPRV